MKIDKNIKPELVASPKSDNRPTLSEPHLRFVNGQAVLLATDGRMMVVIPVAKDETDVEGRVSAAVLKAARQQAGRLGMMEITLGETHATLRDGTSMPRNGTSNDHEYPNYAVALPGGIDEFGCPKIPDHYRPIMTLNAEYLVSIVRALGSEGCVIYGNPEDREDVMIIKPIDSPVPQSAGILMPIRST